MLISGEDGAAVAEARGLLVRSMLGDGFEAEMRLARLGGAEVRRDPALLLDAVKATGFFPGPRAVLVEEATDAAAPALAAALEGWAPGDARIVAAAAGLPARGALRRLFEAAPSAVAITLYDDPPTEAEVLAMAREAGLGRIDADALAALAGVSQSVGTGDLRQLIERLALHEMGSGGALSAETVAALAPVERDADLDAALAAMTDGRQADLGTALDRLAAQGVSPVGVAIGALRHVRAVLAVATDPGGPVAGLVALRPPVGGERRSALARAAGAWRRERLEDALRLLVGVDLRLRSGGPAPEAALLHRALLRVAAMRDG